MQLDIAYASKHLNTLATKRRLMLSIPYAAKHRLILNSKHHLCS